MRSSSRWPRRGQPGTFMLLACLIGVLVGLPSAAGAQEAEQRFITVRTIPPLAGVELQLGQQVATSGPDGTAQFLTDPREPIADTLEVRTRELAVNDRVRARYSRIFGSRGDTVQVAFDMDYAIDFDLVDRGGREVSPGVVGEITLKSALGERLVVERVEEAVWLHGSRVVSTMSGPQVRPVQWSIEDISVGGASVVHRAFNRFEPAAGELVSIELLFFSAEFTVRDALLGTKAGSSIELRFPDGTTRHYALDAEGMVRIERLPRGAYDVVVHGSGPTMSRPVSVTRDQAVDLKFYTWNDISIAVVVVAGCVGGPILLGRRLRRRRRSQLPVPPEAEEAQPLDLVSIERAMSAPWGSAPINVDLSARSPSTAVGVDTTLSTARVDLVDAEWWQLSMVPVPSSRRVGRRRPRRSVLAVLDELTGSCVAATVADVRDEEQVLAVIEEAVAKRCGPESPRPVICHTPQELSINARLIVGGELSSTVELRPRQRAESDVGSLGQWRDTLEGELRRAGAGGGRSAEVTTAPEHDAVASAVRVAVGLHNSTHPDQPHPHSAEIFSSSEPSTP